MGLWSRFSPKRLEKAASKLIQFSGVSFEKIIIEVSTGNFMYCLRCGDTSNPPMVLLHGYCGSGLIFYKILKKLSEHYNLYVLDQIGMGRSSRPSFRAVSTFEAESFFVEGLEACRVFLGLDKFILAGHSFGGYISGCYAIRYTQHVSSLLMLSPGGVTEKPREASPEKTVWDKGWVNKFLLFFWLHHISLIEVMRKLGPASGLVMKNYIRGRYNLPEGELDVIEDFLEQINLLPGSGEDGINYILDFELWPYSPLSRRLVDIKIPIAFFYGDRDWMVSDGGYKTKEMSDSQILVYIISNSDHHMYWDNPEELQEKILEALSLMGEPAPAP